MVPNKQELAELLPTIPRKKFHIAELAKIFEVEVPILEQEVMNTDFGGKIEYDPQSGWFQNFSPPNPKKSIVSIARGGILRIIIGLIMIVLAAVLQRNDLPTSYYHLVGTNNWLVSVIFSLLGVAIITIQIGLFIFMYYSQGDKTIQSAAALLWFRTKT